MVYINEYIFSTLAYHSKHGQLSREYAEVISWSHFNPLQHSYKMCDYSKPTKVCYYICGHWLLSVILVSYCERRDYPVVRYGTSQVAEV